MSTLSPADAAALLDQSRDALFLIESEGQVTPANKAAREWLATDVSVALNTLLQRITPESRDLVASAIKSGRHARYELTSNNGRPIAVSSVPRDEGATLLTIRANDTAPALARSLQQPWQAEYAEELRVARDKAMAADRAKSSFLSNLSHELRTPLNAIIGYSDLLQDGLADRNRDEIEIDVRKIKAAGHHLLALIDELLDLSRLESGKMRTVITPVDAPQLIRGVVEQFNRCTAAQENRIEVQIDPALAEMHTDAGRMRQILFALLSNANKFTRHGVITVRASIDRSDDQASVIITVSDTGIGIKPEQQGTLFEAFSQGDNSATRAYGGLGIGLALTNRMCRTLGGSLHLRSDAPGGTCAMVILPLIAQTIAGDVETEWFAVGPKVDPAAVRFGATDRPHDERRSKVSCVLVIDDDATVRDLMERFLTRQGYDAVSAASGNEGLELARQLRPDIITLDVMMPHKDGWQVLREIKRDPALTAIPVIMLTQVADANLCFALGAADYLRKPVDPQVLSKTINKHVRVLHSPQSAQA